MSCPTCGHTMECIQPSSVLAGVPGHWWCPRCGTTKTGPGTVTVPKLVQRCRKLVVEMPEKTWARMNKSLLQKRGIVEAVYLPEDR